MYCRVPNKVEIYDDSPLRETYLHNFRSSAKSSSGLFTHLGRSLMYKMNKSGPSTSSIKLLLSKQYNLTPYMGIASDVTVHCIGGPRGLEEAWKWVEEGRNVYLIQLVYS